ncbi:MAG TPA: redoxin domain-containing protein, partial [Nitrospinota bacterium]|nr:redoxin domain-containing protein [Nitrospinota bacterium]
MAAVGATLVAISPQLEKYNREIIEQRKLTFEVLSDSRNQVAKKFGLVYILPDDLLKVYLQFGINLNTYNGDDSGTLPIPARFIIDQSSIIRAADVNPDYTVRPEPEDTVEKLKAIANGSF